MNGINKNCFEKIGLARIINANGRMTILGASTACDAVCEAASEAAKAFVVIDDLQDKASEMISSYTGSEASLVTCGASAGIALAIAGCIAKDDLVKIENLPISKGLKNEVILQKGHNVNFGAPIASMIHLGGGQVVEAGLSNKCEIAHVESLITEKTVCLFYVKSHHCVQKGMLDIEEMMNIAKRHNLPLIVDAAAEEDIQKYIDMGVDLVIYSGAKAIESMTSGFITGKKDIIRYAKLQYKGIGRAMKVGKEQIMALLKAIEVYTTKDHKAEVKNQIEIVQTMVTEINKIDHLMAAMIKDEAGREIYRCSVRVDDKFKKTAFDIDHELMAGACSIYCRKYRLNEGFIDFDVRTILKGDELLIIEKLKSIVEGVL